MKKAQIKEVVKDFLVDEFEIDANEITDKAVLTTDLGLESLDLVDVVVIIEEKFGFKVKREDINKIKDLEDLYDYIEKSTSK